MSYCRWSECDLYAYRADRGDGTPIYVVHVAKAAVERGRLNAQYQENDASAFLDRLLWLKSKGCSLASRAVEELRHEISETKA